MRCAWCYTGGYNFFGSATLTSQLHCQTLGTSLGCSTTFVVRRENYGNFTALFLLIFKLVKTFGFLQIMSLWHYITVLHIPRFSTHLTQTAHIYSTVKCKSLYTLVTKTTNNLNVQQLDVVCVRLTHWCSFIITNNKNSFFKISISITISIVTAYSQGLVRWKLSII